MNFLSIPIENTNTSETGSEDFRKTARRPFWPSAGQGEAEGEGAVAGIPFRMDFGGIRETQGTPLCFVIFMNLEQFRSRIQTLLRRVWRISAKPPGAHFGHRLAKEKEGGRGLWPGSPLVTLCKGCGVA